MRSGSTLSRHAYVHLWVYAYAAQDGIVIGRGDDATELDVRHLEQIAEHSQARTGLTA